MCLAIPLEIIEINGKDGLAQRDGIRRPVRLDFIQDPKIGDFVMVHAGFAIERMKREEALQSQELAREAEAELAALREASVL